MDMNRRQTRARWRSHLRMDAERSPALPPVPRPRIASVAVRIQELHLQSFSRLDGRSLADALQHELSSHLSSEGVPDSWLHSHSIAKAKLNDVPIRAGTPAQ